ncbi:uncharacterized protein BKA78DRAFT_9411 [Phyllosticta capitalensis]|uniref:uncharacterized protein n=1 Tax=Phyllosticta capitalensis TaxID=121624 RepID=UPI00312F4E46
MTCSPSSTQEELECSLFVYVRTWHWEGLQLANSFIIPRAPIICYLYLSLTEKWAVRTSRLFLILSFSFSRHWSLQQSWLLQLETLSPVTTMSVKPLLRGFYKTCKRTNVHNLCFSHPCSNDVVVPKLCFLSMQRTLTIRQLDTRTHPSMSDIGSTTGSATNHEVAGLTD